MTEAFSCAQKRSCAHKKEEKLEFLVVIRKKDALKRGTKLRKQGTISAITITCFRVVKIIFIYHWPEIKISLGCLSAVLSPLKRFRR